MVMGEMSGETDLLVIGGGPGGYAAAFRAADLGLGVTLVTEEPRLGGVCLLRGCIPSKALLTQAELIYEAGRAEERGLRFGNADVDTDALRNWKEDLVGRLTDGLARLAEQRDVRIVEGRARFASSSEVRVEGGDLDRIEFEQAVLATGSRPRSLPDVPFDDRVWDSGRALEIDGVPDRLLVVGGGYVGLEMGTVYAALGTEVVLVELEDRLMPRTDPELVEPLERRLQEALAEIHPGTGVEEVEETDEGLRVVLSGEAGGEVTVDRMLVAVGRVPRSDDLDLENTGVSLDDDGFVRVDAQRRTEDESIFAVGDVTGGMLLAHEGIREGKVAAEVAAGEPAAFDVRAVPAVVYTDPQIAWCGLTGPEAEADERDVEVVRFPWRASGRALSMDAGEGLTKLLLEPETGRVLGAGIVGRDAEALIAEAALAVEMGAVARDLAGTVHPHPTLSETLGEAAEMLLGGSTHLGAREDTD